MDVRYSPEQNALRDSVVQVVGSLGVTAVGLLDDAERRAKLDAAVVAAGWRELRTADDHGRPWASGVEVAIVAEELARGCADVSFLGPTLAAELRRLAGAPAATTAETVVLTTDLARVLARQTHAGADDRRARNRGMGLAVDAAGAVSGLVLLEDGDEWTLGSVVLDDASMTTDLTRAIALVADDADVAPIGGTLDGDALDRVLALGLATTAAELVGSMQGNVDLAGGYAAERRQYGQPVGAFQAVQHLLADAFVATEGSRTAARHAAWAVDALPPAEAVAASAVAKAYASRAARTVAETAIQVHGGIGNTWECLAHVHLRRSMLSIDVFGGVDANLELVLDHEIGGVRGLR
jgi:alkylation response protein AidB-like acyl-CoA dehydrogenase